MPEIFCVPRNQYQVPEQCSGSNYRIAKAHATLSAQRCRFVKNLNGDIMNIQLLEPGAKECLILRRQLTISQHFRNTNGRC